MNENAAVKRKRRRAAYRDFIPLRRFTRLLECYNRSYGTSFNYGRAVQALNDGLIDREKFINGRGE